MAIHLILDNHSAHVSRETRAWLAEQPAGRFEFTFTPKHGSWLNLVEGFFSKLARSILRRIRVASNRSSRTASWPPWTTSTTIRLFTHEKAGDLFRLRWREKHAANVGLITRPRLDLALLCPDAAS